MIEGMISAIDVLRLASRLLDHRDIELALLRVPLDPRVFDAAQARALEKALNGRLRRADARALALLARVGLSAGQPGHMQRQTPRRDEALRALVEEVAFDERVGHETLEVVRRLPLHAGGDFFAEEFEEEVGHVSSLEGRLDGSSSQGGQGRRGDRERGTLYGPWIATPLRGIAMTRRQPAPPPAVLSQAAPHALASSRTLRM